ncbi:MAG: FtsX-like permease family protein [Turicibacter sp.]|nr:FtsX-like permease family protein [Turicibacter sp.]
MFILILSLLIFLLDSNRKNEIGLYLALGERKRKIFSQFLLERISLTVLAVVIAFIGIKTFINETFEEFLLREFLYVLGNRRLDLSVGPLESAGFFHQVTYRDLLEAFEISFATNDVIFILIIIFVPVLIATTASLSVLTRKKIVDLIK